MKDALAAELVTALSRTVLDPKCWDAALHSLCEYCGASKALISRRTLRGAQIVIPTTLQNEWQSPLIYGFSRQEVETFLAQFASTDPWNQIEAQNFPFTPYELSRFLPLKKLQETMFWGWLEPQGLVDSIVAVVDQDDTGWTALNLYLDAEQARNSDQIIHRLSEVLSDLKEVWTAGRDVFIARSDYWPIPSIVEHMSDPCIVVDLKHVVSTLNAAATHLTEAGVLQAIPGETLALPQQWSPYLPKELTSLAGFSASDEAEKWQPFVAKDVRLEHLSGESNGYRILFIMRKQDVVKAAPDWEHSNLNEREKLLVRLLAHGGKVKDGAELFGISVRANADIWKSASVKLGGLKKQDLVLRNRDFTKDEEK
ncbi:hypothetical protein [uncultured Pelagimonas sp.]|uniref:hypothetical protein n=1 Tax=uncultured Pelagimonas sp. TaxID=1618102 RepID=UPI00262CC60C|nr:hypothetical protein [uncultured Pelagimonas sp.]